MKVNNFTYCPVSETYKEILLPVTYSLVFVLGLALNGRLLWLVCFRTKTWSCSVIYLVNLAVADLLHVLTLPLLIVSYAMYDVWLFGDAACKAVRFFFYTNLHGSIMFLMCISIHRFLGVCYPIKAIKYRTKRIAVLASALVWILVTGEIFPTLAFAHSGFINNVTVCFDLTSPGKFKQYFPYGMFLSVVGFLLPFLVIVTCYCLMMRTLSTIDDNIKVGKEMRTKSVRTILVVCLLFALCFVPYHIMRTIYLFVRVYLASNCTVLNVVMVTYKIWRPIASFNSCINPILYFMCSDRQRKKLFANMCKKRVHPSACAAQVRGTMGNRCTPSEDIQGKWDSYRISVAQSTGSLTPRQTIANTEMCD
ncbi:P2Y purinoceptor 3-like [Megalops cyprinoides]|uniref:P2Y purinoceptor 3-like n=1 Tax=Megalops cyprinoides TaxID=118141 RepID=UPI0018653C03|nr:P2Y purinoceptor 3-like [Megalops cyprinoides]